MAKFLDYNGLSHFKDKIVNLINKKTTTYIGPTEPTDDANLWLDTSVPSTDPALVDPIPIEDSPNLITSGGVFDAISNIPAPAPQIDGAIEFGIMAPTSMVTNTTQVYTLQKSYSEMYACIVMPVAAYTPVLIGFEAPNTVKFYMYNASGYSKDPQTVHYIFIGKEATSE